MNNIIIERVKPEQLKTLADISQETFYEAFIWGNTEENIQAYILKAFNEDQLSKEMKSAESEFYFAIINNVIAGYLKINSGTMQTENVDGDSLEVERIYVVKEFRRMNIGQAMFDKALARARELKKKCLWLGVWDKNDAAIRFYERNGLSQFSSHTFKVGEDEQTDIMMKILL